MGDPSQFSIRKGANPHTRNWLGMKKSVDRRKALRQWNRMKETLEEYGVKVHVIPPHPAMPGLVFPANAGFTPRVEMPIPLARRDFILSRLSTARGDEEKVYEEFLKGLGLRVHRSAHAFEGEADFFPWGEKYIFTYGRLEKQRFVPRWGFPPWKRVYGFRSDAETLGDLISWVPRENILPFELQDERFYHGDTVFCSFGPRREFLLAYAGGLTSEGWRGLKGDPRVIPMTREDALRFAANSFQIRLRGDCFLFMPVGVSEELVSRVREMGVEVVKIDVSEFYVKGGGSVKCMIGDLGSDAV